MTKREYINKHPRSYLAQKLNCIDWDDDREIELVSGLIAPTNKCSNLYKALQRAKFKKYVVGGHRQHGTEGWWIAVS